MLGTPFAPRIAWRVPGFGLSDARAAYGILDKRLGVSNKSDTCETCGRRLADCTGHFGYIQLRLPVFHIGFIKATINVLQSICKSCSRVLCDADFRRIMLKQMRDPKTGTYGGNAPN